MGLAVHNLGIQECTNVYARLNIDKLNETNTYETVFTDTLKYGNLTSETSKIRNKNITDTDWYSVENLGMFTLYQWMKTIKMNPTIILVTL